MKIKRVYLEITDACNLDCPFCTNEKGHSFMSLDMIKDYMCQIKDVSDYLYLHVLGEPLLHPEIEEIFSLADSLNLSIQLVTNGTLLSKHLTILDHPSLRKLSISLHSISNTNIDNNYFETIKRIIEKDLSCYIELRFYNLNDLSADLKAFLNELKQTYNFMETPKINSYRLKNNAYVYFAELFDWPNINDPFISDYGKCHGAIDQIAILHDSKVSLCCLDPKAFNTIGDLKKDSLISILNGPLYLETIDNFRNGKLTFELCKRCSYRLRFDGKRNLKQ